MHEVHEPSQSHRHKRTKGTARVATICDCDWRQRKQDILTRLAANVKRLNHCTVSLDRVVSKACAAVQCVYQSTGETGVDVVSTASLHVVHGASGSPELQVG